MPLWKTISIKASDLTSAAQLILFWRWSLLASMVVCWLAFGYVWNLENILLHPNPEVPHELGLPVTVLMYSCAIGFFWLQRVFVLLLSKPAKASVELGVIYTCLALNFLYVAVEGMHFFAKFPLTVISFFGTSLLIMGIVSFFALAPTAKRLSDAMEPLIQMKGQATYFCNSCSRESAEDGKCTCGANYIRGAWCSKCSDFLRLKVGARCPDHDVELTSDLKPFTNPQLIKLLARGKMPALNLK
jgi:hypothetical protein